MLPIWTRLIKIFAFVLLCIIMLHLIFLIGSPTDSDQMAAKLKAANNNVNDYEYEDYEDEWGELAVNAELRQLLESNRHQGWSLPDNCAPYPRFEDLQFESIYYQKWQADNLTYYLFSAYYDRRQTVASAPQVTVLAMLSTVKGPYPPTYCQLWYEGVATPDLAPVHKHQVPWYPAWGDVKGFYYPTLISCELPKSQHRHRVPQLVSLVYNSSCERASNALEVIYEAPERQRAARFAVCVKELKFEQLDKSERFVEWLELLRLLGAERVTVYAGPGHLQSNTTRTLRHYDRRDGLLRLRSHRTLLPPGIEPNDGLNAMLNEVLLYNDCLYRNMYQFDYIGVFDVDEIIMPLADNNWTALLQRLEAMGNLNGVDSNCQAWCGYSFRNVYFPRYPDRPPRDRAALLAPEFYMVRHVQRVAQHLDPNSAIKCLHSTAYSTALHNHFALQWVDSCGPQGVPIELGQMQHYREPDDKTTLVHPVIDDNIWRFQEPLMKRCRSAHRELGWRP